ncbi:GAF domain-containing protein [Ramlibacter henchirensis]|uniref:histidine kinase n=1 Tax=Ramlibacter henchirensis TaxID=204072 RepID=A0A4Z0BNT0_9BURK|nr:ATP-binding protein [Ramlibacter henchirensis]TFZ00977.1 GAF domain-containing protein [Ramlibacter henchirensis]
MTDAQPAPPDLSACAAEPIHVPGAIQPHGALLLVQRTGQVLQASANSVELLKSPQAELAGQRLHELFDAGSGDELLDAVLRAHVHEAPVRGLDGSPLFATCHWVGELIIVELERLEGHSDFAGGLDVALRAIATAEDEAALVATCNSHVRALSGFDRVMIYRFDEDGHGEVIAEDRHPELDPYLGHHYPESDIPRQARALYLRNWIRCIPDASYRPVPLVPTLRPDSGEPLDLSGAHLRSVSPVHLEYLANMGVRASMSVSLIVDGQLWGLISCGHRTPKQMPPGLRRSCELIGRLLSTQLGALRATEFHKREAAARETLAALRAAMRADPSRLLRALVTEPHHLLGLVGASGAAWIDGEETGRIGNCPDEAEVGQIATYVRTNVDNGFFSTRQLPLEHPGSVGLAAVASGVMAITLPPGDRMLLWFRPQVPHTVLWGGDPAKSARIEVENGIPRLHPRRSFAVWKEEIRGKSLPWHPVERHLASELRRHAVEIDLAHQVESHKAAVRARDELVAAVSHDLRTPVSIVAMQATLIQRFVGTDPGEGSKRLATSALVIQRAADRMTTMLRDLVDLARIEAGRFQVQPLAQDGAVLIYEACELMRHLAEARHQQLVAHEPASMYVAADPERIFHVFANLIGNAIKFTPEGGVITVGAVPRGDRCEFYVQDTGRGIPADQLEKVFGRYWQARGADQAAGLGLGLYICHGIVAAHGGRIWAESAPDRGSTFRFELPCAPTPNPVRETG